jgi:hypothetical protein
MGDGWMAERADPVALNDNPIWIKFDMRVEDPTEVLGCENAAVEEEGISIRGRSE